MSVSLPSRCSSFSSPDEQRQQKLNRKVDERDVREALSLVISSSRRASWPQASRPRWHSPRACESNAINTPQSQSATAAPPRPQLKELKNTQKTLHNTHQTHHQGPWKQTLLGLALTHVLGVGGASPVQWSSGPQSRGRSGGRPSLALAAY